MISVNFAQKLLRRTIACVFAHFEVNIPPIKLFLIGMDFGFESAILGWNMIIKNIN